MSIRAVSKPPVALIAGPTASGKSTLAIALSERSNGVVINADSAQIYRDIPILSATPTEQDRARVDHRLYAFRDGADPCSAAEWAELAKAEIRQVHASGRLPILVGGTGLYLRTLLDGIAPVPPIDADIRRRVRTRETKENRAELEGLDPAGALRVNAADATRIARALEVILSTGRTLAEWQDGKEGGIGGSVELRPLILLPPRPWLYERCDARFLTMAENGAVDEVSALQGRGLDPALPVMRAIGVREIAAFLGGEVDRKEMVRRGQQATRNYAKRQYTWFTHQPPVEWPRFMEALDQRAIPVALALLQQSA